MDCNCNQRSAGSCRPQMPPPPCMNTSCGCGSQTPMPPIQPRMTEPACSMPGCGEKTPCGTGMPCGGRPSCGIKPSCGVRPACGTVPSAGIMPDMNVRCPSGCRSDKIPCNMDPVNMPIAMAYVPWQQWRQTYPMEKGFSRGTIFPELDLPFVMGRCR